LFKISADTRTTEEAELLETELQAARKEIDVLRKEVQKLRSKKIRLADRFFLHLCVGM